MLLLLLISSIEIMDGEELSIVKVMLFKPEYALPLRSEPKTVIIDCPLKLFGTSHK